MQTLQKTSSLFAYCSKLPPELEEGNIEYKLKLINPSKERIQHLTTQLKWRLAEGNGEAIYEIGVSDKGILVGLDPKEMKESLETLAKMGTAISARFFVSRTRKVKKNRSVTEVIFRSGPNDQHFLELRVVILGGVDAGKSTLLSVLCYGDNDDGEGKGRLNLLRHRHEIETGRSSSIARQIIGFNSNGGVINYASTNISTWEQVCENAARIVTFLDVPGHPKYQKTTVSGLIGDSPDYACLILSATYAGIPEVSRDHVMLTKLLNVPLMIIITKIDIATSNQLGKTLEALMKLLKSPCILRSPVVIQNEDDLSSSIPAIVSSQIVPLFLTSNVTGENTDLLMKMFNRLPKSLSEIEKDLEKDMQFQVQDIFTIQGVGCVLGGIMITGQLYLGGSGPQICYLGPNHGKFITVIVHCLHRQRLQVQNLQAGQVGTCAIKFQKQIPTSSLNDKENNWFETCPVDFKLRRGQVLLPFTYEPVSYWEVIVDLFVLTHPTALFIGEELKLHCISISQTAKIIQISSPSSTLAPVLASKEINYGVMNESRLIMRSKKRRWSSDGLRLEPGRHGYVTFRFKNEPEFLLSGSTVLVRGGPLIKCVGKVINCSRKH